MCLKIILQFTEFSTGVVVTVMKIKWMLLYRCKSFEIQHTYQMSPFS